MHKECENLMEKLLNDVDESLDLLTEKRMAEVWKNNAEMKELSEQVAKAERNYQKLELPDEIRNTIEELTVSSGRLENYCEKMLYRQGLMDGYLLMKHMERHRLVQEDEIQECNG